MRRHEELTGFDAALFVEAPPEYATCSVCLGVLNDPHSCLQGHRRAPRSQNLVRPLRRQHAMQPLRRITAVTDALRDALRVVCTLRALR